MKIHHLDCGSLCPLSARLFPTLFPSVIVCHCLLIETDAGLVLVDTGLSEADMTDPRRMGPSRLLLRPNPSVPHRPAVAQVRDLGFDPRDVTHLVTTHLDYDHAGGVADFPHATVHAWADELEAAIRRQSFTSRSRYLPVQWARHRRWALHDAADGERWFGFDAVRPLEGLPPELLLVPLPGHTLGHMGVAVDTDEGWLLHAGDAYYDRRELEQPGRGAPGFRFLERFIHEDQTQAHANRARLRALALDPQAPVRVFCAHDPGELGSFAQSASGA